MTQLMKPQFSALEDPFRAVDDLFRGFFVRPVDWNWNEANQFRLEVRDIGEQFQINAELPGVAKDDIDVQIDDDVVSINAEMKRNFTEKEGERVLRAERYYGKTSRTFQLTQAVDEDKAEAHFENGVLTLLLPKKDEGSKRKQLKIH